MFLPCRFQEWVDAAVGPRAVAAAAAREGYRGPCGVDAFVFRAGDGSECLRPEFLVTSEEAP